MDEGKKNCLMKLVGRIALSAIFIMGGLSKITGFAGIVGYAAAYAVPFPELAILAAIIIELVGGLMILVGFKTKRAALALALFLIPVTFIFHTDFANPIEMAMFTKNLAIFGGLLYVAAAGAGRYSLDEKKKAV